MKFYAVIVIYNKEILNSLSIRSLIEINDENIQILVIDNSSENYVKNNKLIAENSNIYYHPMNCNAGLSKAYNFALDTLSDKKDDDLVVWFDDDTPITPEYFNVLRKATICSNSDVYVPVIYGQNGVIYSPNKKGLLKGIYIKSTNEKIPSDRFNAINSCLAVRIRVYKKYRYDESLFMDCVDTKMFDDFRKMNLSFEVLDISIQQNFFQRDNERNVHKYWRRFEIRIKDTVTYGGTTLKGRIISIIRIYGWALVYGIKLKSIEFFLKCIFLGTKLLVKKAR